MERLELSAQKREETGKGSARKLRETGMIPAVLYGKNREPVNLKLDASEVEEVIGGNVIIDLSLEDETEPVMTKEVQRHIIKGDLLHVDFYQVDLEQKIEVEVPVETVGQSIGEREGGILEIILRKVEISCLPTDIPETFEVDISELEVGDSVSVADLEVDENVEILTDNDETIATIVVPSELDLDEEDEEEELEEPEVIGEVDDEEEEGEDGEVEAEETEE